MKKENEEKKLKKIKKIEIHPDVKKSEDIDDFIFEDEGYETSDK